jgi:hypothetical protein
VHGKCRHCKGERDFPDGSDPGLVLEVDSTIRYPDQEKEKGVLMRKGSKRNQEKFLELERRKDEIIKVWEACDRNTYQAAKALKMSATTLIGKLQQWKLKPHKGTDAAAGSDTKSSPRDPDYLSILIDDKCEELRQAKENVALIESDIEALRRTQVLILQKQGKE